ncbi:MAG: hypothetical protein LBH32_05840 [Dysgonamonadaceae bacterium]|jgi:hypothetical protein|nr:hypothetical protein [Dysgonamonadaceae bacterium]
MKKLRCKFVFAFLCVMINLPLFSQNANEPSSGALMIPMQKSSVSVLFDPTGNAFFSEDGINGASNDLTLDLGNIDFGANQFNKVWVEMSYMGNVTGDSKFAFYLDDELMLPNTQLDIPVKLPVEDYNSDAIPQGGLFFKNRQVENVSVFDVRGDASVAKITSCVLQGILNQEEAGVYLYLEGHHLPQLEETGRNFTVYERLENRNFGGLGSIILKYKNRFDKLVVWDESKEWTWCLAQMISARQKGIPVTPEIKNYIVEELGWNKAIYDIRDMWNDKLTAYQWALDNLSVGCHPTLSFSAGLRNDYPTAPWKIYDYAAASKGFVFFLNEKVAAESAMIEKIYQKMNYPVGSSVMGYGASDDGDGLNSITNKYNVGFMVSDYYANGSYWCSFPSKSFKQRRGQAIDAQPGKVYVSLIWSDGDNIQFDANAFYLMFKNANRRGEVPVGFTMAASLQELNPTLLEFFYKNLTSNDELMAGPSGFQFIYGDSFTESAYPAWLEMNNQWMKTAGFNTACLWNTANWNRFDEYMRTCGLQGVFDGWSKSDNRYINGVVAINQGAHCFSEGDVYNDLIKAIPNPDKPVFRNLYLIAANYGGSGGYERLIRELERLESYLPNTYVYMLPMDLAATLQKYIIKNNGSY